MIEETTVETKSEVRIERGDLAYWAEMAFLIEKARISPQVRLEHLSKLDRESPKTKELYDMILNVESFVDGEMARVIMSHPTWEWASLIKGVGKENYPKVIGLIEQFGTFYDPGAELIPPYVDRAPAPYKKLVDGNPVAMEGVWVSGIERLVVPSKMWKYAGFSVDPETGKAPKRTSGKKLGYNSGLRMACYRLCGSLMRARGIWYTGGDPKEGFSRGYLGHKTVIRSMKESQGYEFKSPPSQRLCVDCGAEVKKKAARFCPICGGRLSLKEEPKGVIFLGHLDAMAKRKMMKDFLLCLWIVWRKAEGLPAPVPYNVRFLEEPLIDPWKMTDK